MKNSRQRAKFNNWINLSVSIILIILGITLLIFPWMGIENSSLSLYVLFSIYGIIKMIEYYIVHAKDDHEDLYTGIACTLAAVSGLKFVNYQTALVLGITLISWIAIMGVIKLIKLDYYHDRKDDMFYVNLVTFSLFLLIGILTSINLYYEVAIQTIMLGFFFVINGLLNLAEDGIRIIINSKNKKSDKK